MYLGDMLSAATGLSKKVTTTVGAADGVADVGPEVGTWAHPQAHTIHTTATAPIFRTPASSIPA